MSIYRLGNVVQNEVPAKSDRRMNATKNIIFLVVWMTPHKLIVGILWALQVLAVNQSFRVHFFLYCPNPVTMMAHRAGKPSDEAGLVKFILFPWTFNIDQGGRGHSHWKDVRVGSPR